MTTQSYRLIAILLALGAVPTNGYSLGILPNIVPAVAVVVPPLLLKKSIANNKNPFKSQGLDVETPDFDELFGRIKQVSPLANAVISRENDNRGLQGVAGNSGPANLKWKKVESNKRGTVHQIERLDGFQGLSAPMLRFRSTLEGPCVGEFFGKFIIDLAERKKWDAQIKDVYEIHPIDDLNSANLAMGLGQYGDCSRLGIGYCETVASMGVTPREQLFLYGLQDFADGSHVIWGTEMEDQYNHLLPSGKRHTRAKSHLFSATLTPTSENSFDVEYVLQLDIGGNIPKFLTTPVMIETVKKLFGTAKSEFASVGEGGALDAFLEDNMKQQETMLGSIQGLLTATA